MKERGIKESMRRAAGNTIVSLLIACILGAVLELGLVSLLSMNSSQSVFLWARLDTLNSVNYALTIMGQRIRAARNLGELYGVAPPPQARVVGLLPPGPQAHPEAVDNSQIPVSQIQSGTVTMLANYFPSSGDPLYGPGGSLAVSSWPWGLGPSSPISLSSTFLIVQVPAFDSNGFPLSLPPGYVGAPQLCALDTYIYNVLPDPSRAGKYMMQMAYFPAPANLTNVPNSIAPGTVTTVITGIVGPIANGSPCVFQYIQKFNPTPSVTVTPGELQNYSGVIVNLEIANTDGRGRTALLPVRSEFYMRNNVSATTIGSPPSN